MFVNTVLNGLADQMHRSGHLGTARSYRTTLRRLFSVLGDDIPESGIFSPEGILLYEKRLYARGLAKSTISFYMRTLRAMYNKGADNGSWPKQPHLFDNVYTGIQPTPKRAINPGILGQLQELDLSEKKKLAFTRDMFLLSYGLQGIAFADLFSLRKCDLRGELLFYHRVKTGSPVLVAISPFALEIIGRYAAQTQGSQYLLPLIENPDGDLYLQRCSALKTYNRHLEKLRVMLGVDDKLTSYVVRHTWATTAQRVEIPIALISQALGHQAEKVTHVYLSGFDQSALFEANKKILIAAGLITGCKTADKAVKREGEENVSRLRRERHFPMQT